MRDEAATDGPLSHEASPGARISLLQRGERQFIHELEQKINPNIENSAIFYKYHSFF